MEGATCPSCAPDGSRESVKCQVWQEACVPRWNKQLHDQYRRSRQNIFCYKNNDKRSRYLHRHLRLCISVVLTIILLVELLVFPVRLTLRETG